MAAINWRARPALCLLVPKQELGNEIMINLNYASLIINYHKVFVY